MRLTIVPVHTLCEIVLFFFKKRENRFNSRGQLYVLRRKFNREGLIQALKPFSSPSHRDQESHSGHVTQVKPRLSSPHYCTFLILDRLRISQRDMIQKRVFVHLICSKEGRAAQCTEKQRCRGKISMHASPFFFFPHQRLLLAVRSQSR